MTDRNRIAFVLGGGGHRGAHEVGMLRAVIETGIRPDLVVGTSVGAVNGVVVAADPSMSAIERLTALWTEAERYDVFGGSVLTRVRTLVRSRTHIHPNDPLRRVLEQLLPVATFDELPVRFQCVAASIERAAEHWFTSGPLVDAVLASAAVPGLLPPVEIDGEHYLDGGLVNSIPVGRAIRLGAGTVYVMQVGRIERPLTPPRMPWDVALVAFEIARRHRFAHDLGDLPEGVHVHVLPTGDPDPVRYTDLATQLAYRDFSRTAQRVDQAYVATRAYLDEARR